MPTFGEVLRLNEALEMLRSQLDKVGVVLGPVERRFGVFANQMDNVGNTTHKHSVGINHLQKSYKSLSKDLKKQVQMLHGTRLMTEKLGVSKAQLSKAVSDVHKSILQGTKASQASMDIYKGLVRVNQQYAKQLDHAIKQQKNLEWAMKSTGSKVKDAVGGTLKAVTGFKTWLASTVGLSLGMGQLQKTLTDYNRTVFESVQLSTAYGQGLDEFVKGQEIARRSTTLSMQAFAEINKSFQELYVGIPPTASEVANFSAMLQKNLGYSAEVTAKKIQDLLSLQQRMPDVVDRVREAMQAYNRSATEGDRVASALQIRMRALGMSMSEIRRVMVSIREPNSEVKARMELEKSAAEAEKARRDAELLTAQKLEGAMKGLNKTLEDVANTFGGLHKSIIWTTAAMVGVGAAIPVLIRLGEVITGLTGKMMMLQAVSGGGLLGGIGSGLAGAGLAMGVGSAMSLATPAVTGTMGATSAAMTGATVTGAMTGATVTGGVATGATTTGTVATGGGLVLGAKGLAGAIAAGITPAILPLLATVAAPAAALTAGVLLWERSVKKQGERDKEVGGATLSVSARSRTLGSEAFGAGFVGDRDTRRTIARETDLPKRHKLMVDALEAEFKSLKTEQEIEKAIELTNNARKKGLLNTQELNKLADALKLSAGDREKLEAKIANTVGRQNVEYNRTKDLLMLITSQTERMKQMLDITIDQSGKISSGMSGVLSHFQSLGVVAGMTKNELDLINEVITTELNASLRKTEQSMNEAFIVSLANSGKLMEELVKSMDAVSKVKFEENVEKYQERQAVVLATQELIAQKEREIQEKTVQLDDKNLTWLEKRSIETSKRKDEEALKGMQRRMGVARKEADEAKGIIDEIANTSKIPMKFDDTSIEILKQELAEINRQIESMGKIEPGDREGLKTLEDLNARQQEINHSIDQGMIAQKEQKKIESDLLKTKTDIITAEARARKEAMNITLSAQQAQIDLEKTFNFGVNATIESLRRMSQTYVDMVGEIRKEMSGVEVATNATLKEFVGVDNTLEAMNINLKDINLTQEDVIKKVNEYADLNKDLKLTDEERAKMAERIFQNANRTKNLRVEERQIMQKHVELTKEVREGWLQANKEFIANAGVFSGILPTMERAVSAFAEVESEAFKGGGSPIIGATAQKSDPIAAAVRDMTAPQYHTESRVPPADVSGYHGKRMKEERETLDEQYNHAASKPFSVEAAKAMLGPGEAAAARQAALEKGVSSAVLVAGDALPQSEQAVFFRKEIDRLHEQTKLARGGQIPSKDPMFVINKNRVNQYKDVISSLNPTMVTGGVPGKDSVNVAGTNAAGEAIVHGRENIAIAAMMNAGKIKRTGNIPKRGFGGGVPRDLGVPGFARGGMVLPSGDMPSIESNQIQLPNSVVQESTVGRSGSGGTTEVELKLNPEVRDLLAISGKTNYRTGTRY